MKQTIKLSMALLLILGLSSCGVNRSWVLNHNQNTTQVHLGQDNFKVVGQVQGQSEVSYVLIFGGPQKKRLYESAYADMLEKAELSSGPRTVTHVLTEEQLGGVPPFFYKRTVNVSATVIEFTE